MKNDQDRILAEGIGHFHSQFGRHREQRAQQSRNEEEGPTDVSSPRFVEADSAFCQGHGAEYQEEQRDEEVRAGLVRDGSDDDGGEHDDDLEESPDERDVDGRGGGFAGLVVGSSFVVDAPAFVVAVADADQVVEVGGEGVDDDAADGEDDQGVGEALAGEAGFGGQEDLVVANVDFEMMGRLRHGGFGSFDVGGFVHGIGCREKGRRWRPRRGQRRANGFRRQPTREECGVGRPHGWKMLPQ